MISTDRLLLTPTSYAGKSPTAWRMTDRATGETVGTIGFVGREADGSLIVGYEVANEWRGRGLATEALTAVLTYVADSGAARAVVAETDLDHAASRRVMEKAGMSIREMDGARVRYAFDCHPAVRSAP